MLYVLCCLFIIVVIGLIIFGVSVYDLFYTINDTQFMASVAYAVLLAIFVCMFIAIMFGCKLIAILLS